jgi:uncharacterized protein YjiS (DUF1127 family)
MLIAAIANELRIRRDVRQLAAMDDQMLKDIGLRRGEIEYCVRYGSANEPSRHRTWQPPSSSPQGSNAIDRPP